MSWGGLIISAVAGMALLLKGQSSSVTMLMLSLVLWALLLTGNMLVALLGAEETDHDDAKG